jgi:hypothetical protein
VVAVHLFVWFACIPSCIAIGYIDYLVLNKWTACDKCGFTNDKWYTWVLPTFLEIVLFLCGIAIGVNVT